MEVRNNETVIERCDVPLFHGVELRVTKSTTSCSISSTVMLFPFITVRLGTGGIRGSVGVPPLNMIYGSLAQVYIEHVYTLYEI